MVIKMVDFKINKEQLKALKEEIKKYKDLPGPLMPILHSAQHIFGCVPVEVQKIISDALNIPIAKINGVVTFYARFSLTPKGKHVIGVCLGTACYVRGSQLILDEMKKALGIEVGETTPDGLFTLEATRCIGACGLAPVFAIGAKVYGSATPKIGRDAISEVLNEVNNQTNGNN